MKFLFDLSPIIAGAVVGGTRLLVVLTGMHLSLGAICMENLSQFGYDVLLPINTMGTMALVGVTLGVWFKSKRNDTKSVAMSSFISAFIGIYRTRYLWCFIEVLKMHYYLLCLQELSEEHL